MARGETAPEKRRRAGAQRADVSRIFPATATAAPRVHNSSIPGATRSAVQIVREFDQLCEVVELNQQKSARKNMIARLELLDEEPHHIPRSDKYGGYFPLEETVMLERPPGRAGARHRCVVERILIEDLLVARHVLQDNRLEQRIAQALAKRFASAELIWADLDPHDQHVFKHFHELWKAGLPADKLSLKHRNATQIQGCDMPVVSKDPAQIARALVARTYYLGRNDMYAGTAAAAGLALADLASAPDATDQQLRDAAWAYLQRMGVDCESNGKLFRKTLTTDEVRLVLKMAGLRQALFSVDNQDTFEKRRADILSLVWDHNPRAAAGSLQKLHVSGRNIVAQAGGVIAKVDAFMGRHDADARTALAAAGMNTSDVIVSSCHTGPATASEVDRDLRSLAMHAKRYLPLNGALLLPLPVRMVRRVTQEVQPRAIVELLDQHRGETDILLEVSGVSGRGGIHELRLTLTRLFDGADPKDTSGAVVHRATTAINLQKLSHQQRQKKVTALMEQIAPGFSQLMVEAHGCEWARGSCAAYADRISALLHDPASTGAPVRSNTWNSGFNLVGHSATSSFEDTDLWKRKRKSATYFKPHCVHDDVKWEDEVHTASVIAVCAECGERPLKTYARHQVTDEALEQAGLPPSIFDHEEAARFSHKNLTLRSAPPTHPPELIDASYLMRERVRDIAAGRVSVRSLEDLQARDAPIAELVWESPEKAEAVIPRARSRRLRV